MSPSPQLQKLLSLLEDPREGMNFMRLLEAIHAVRYTGPITLHCFNGTPQQVDLGAPIRLSIVEGRPPAAGGLDTAKSSG